MATNRRFMPVPPEAVWEVLADPAGYEYWVVGSKVIRDAEPGFPGAGHASSITRSASARSRCDDHTEVLEAERPGLLRLRAKGRPLGTATVTLRMTPRGRRDARCEMVENPDGPYAIAQRQPAAAPGHQGAQRGVADAPRGAGAAPMKGSIWLETAPDAPAFAAARRATCAADVCVIGGGIVGVTAALLLPRPACAWC